MADAPPPPPPYEADGPPPPAYAFDGADEEDEVELPPPSYTDDGETVAAEEDLEEGEIALAGSEWHYEMLNDKPRNEAFVLAVERAVAAASAGLAHRAKGTTSPTVLEIGSGGTALLSRAAARAGAAPVVAVEVDPVLARRARAVAEHNGLGSTVTVLEVHR